MDIVTLQDVKDRINVIVSIAADDEVAHSMEDDLYRDVLYTIAQNQLTTHEVSLLALEALRTDAIDFIR